MKEETTGVCMHPPIKTRLVGTLAGRGARPGEVRRAGATRRQPVGVHEHQTSGGARGHRGSHSRMTAEFGPAIPGQTGTHGCGPAPSSLGLKNREEFVLLEPC